MCNEQPTDLRSKKVAQELVILFEKVEPNPNELETTSCFTIPELSFNVNLNPFEHHMLAICQALVNA